MCRHRMASCCSEKPAKWSLLTVLTTSSDSLLQCDQSWNVTHCLVFILFLGNRILTLGEVPKDQVYGVKLKGVSVCFAMLKAVLSGNYVNFGVFRLYGDDALDNALQTFIKLLLSIPHSDLLVNTKLIQMNCITSIAGCVCWPHSTHLPCCAGLP